MSRAEYRRQQRESQKLSKTYTLTQAQIDQMKETVRKQAVHEVLTLMLAIPCEILISEGYWEKTAKKKMPKFLDECLSLYSAYEQGVVTMEQMQEDLKKYGGIEVYMK